jgi:dihydrofolate reductase
MRKVIVFIMISLDGYFEGPDHELDWHNVDAEFNDTFAMPQLNEADTLIFGRRTYELMVSYWPTDAAQRNDSAIAGKMNSLPKIVFSRTLKNADWHNTTLLQENATEQLRELKDTPGKDMLVLGSSKLCVSLLSAGLIDEIRLIVNPVILGKGNTVFGGITEPVRMQLLDTKTFKSDNVLLRYTPQKSI